MQLPPPGIPLRIYSLSCNIMDIPSKRSRKPALSRLTPPANSTQTVILAYIYSSTTNASVLFVLQVSLPLLHENYFLILTHLAIYIYTLHTYICTRNISLPGRLHLYYGNTHTNGGRASRGTIRQPYFPPFTWDSPFWGDPSRREEVWN